MDARQHLSAPAAGSVDHRAGGGSGGGKQHRLSPAGFGRWQSCQLRLVGRGLPGGVLVGGARRGAAPRCPPGAGRSRARVRPGARGAARLAGPAKARADRVSIRLAAAALACYGALYLINALAPELEPDARAYHLGLTSEYVRLGGFPSRVGFYEMLPQGFEMLFVPAFAFGRHSKPCGSIS